MGVLGLLTYRAWKTQKTAKESGQYFLRFARPISSRHSSRYMIINSRLQPLQPGLRHVPE